MAAVVTLSAGALDAFVGKSIVDICGTGFGSVGDVENHCAHFVSHVLKINDATGIGLTCSGMTNAKYKPKGAGGCIRVHEIYNFCSDLIAAEEKGCLVYITKATNISSKDCTMGNIPKKHIGIYFQGIVWHYGNTNDQVKRQRLSDFESDISTAYGGGTVTRFTVIPDGAELLTIAQIKDLAK